MTISTLTNVTFYTADGDDDTYAIGFTFYQNSDIYVWVDTVLQTQNVAYTISGSNIVFTAGDVVAGKKIVIARIMDLVQETVYRNFDGNPSDVAENAFDYQTMIVQQIQNEASRTLRIPITSVGINTDLPAPVAYTTFVWKEDESGLQGSALPVDEHLQSASDAADDANAALATIQGLQSTASSAASAATASAGNAASAAAAAVQAAGSINLPTLTPGSAGKILQVNSGENGYDLRTRVQFLDNGTGVNGDLLVRSGGNWNRLAIGPEGQILTDLGGAVAWITPPLASTASSGYAQYATDAQVQAGVATDRVIAPTNMRTLGLTRTFVTADTPFTLGANLTFTTIANWTTTLVVLYLVCVTNDDEWVAGDVVSYSNFGAGSNNASGMTLYSLSNGIGVRITSANITIQKKISNAQYNITVSRWRLRAVILGYGPIF